MKKHARTEIISVADVLRWGPVLSAGCLAELDALEPPQAVGDFKAPQSLDEITLEDLCRLQDDTTDWGLFCSIGGIFFRKSPEEVVHMPAAEMVGLKNMVVRELARISGLFSALGREFNAHEIMAGADKLDFGIFGLADWYAQRMGITSHDEAFKTPWIRIYQCRLNDLREMEYRERLHEIQMNDLKTR